MERFLIGTEQRPKTQKDRKTERQKDRTEERKRDNGKGEKGLTVKKGRNSFTFKKDQLY